MEYITQGTCARKIIFELDGTKIKSVKFEGGCPGNLMGISQMIIGMEAKEVIEKFEGIGCKGKQTSCPDQLAMALKAYIEEK